MIRNDGKYPRGWEISSEEFESVLLKLPPDVTRVTASMRLSIEAEFGGWELSRVRLYSDGTRKVLLRRRRTARERRADHGRAAHNGTAYASSAPDSPAYDSSAYDSSGASA